VKRLVATTLLLLLAGATFSQETKCKRAMYVREPMITDSTSTLMIPIDAEEFISSKSGEYFCANLLVYNFKTDETFKLFDHNLHIVGYRTYTSSLYWREKSEKSIFKDWILYEVKADHNINGKMEGSDPVVLYCSNLRGGNLKQLTPETENVVSIEVYQKQGFALITMQRDKDQDSKFSNDDRDYYFVKLDLSTLTLGNRFNMK
jgi:hypothetical protein